MKKISTIAKAKLISAAEYIKNKDGFTVGVDNEGQYCMALVPNWANWGQTLIDGTELKEGKYYKITIEEISK